jgi:glycerophosphoryl diester phosphodiesterase
MLLKRPRGSSLATRRIVRRFAAATSAGIILIALLELTASHPAGAAPKVSYAAPKGCGSMALYWHRGDRYTGHTENSRSALRIAVAKGYGLETDLRTTEDGRIILMHDATINRTTTGKGRVSHLTAKQIRSHRLDDGSKVPYLAGAIQVLESHEGSTGMMELKPNAMPGKSLKLLSSHLDDHGLRHRVVVYSSDRGELADFEKVNKGIATSLIPNGRELKWRADSFVPYGGATVRSPDVRDLSRRARKIDLPVTAWAARGHHAWKMNVNAGTSALILNHPNRYTRWCEK